MLIWWFQCPFSCLLNILKHIGPKENGKHEEFYLKNGFDLLYLETLPKVAIDIHSHYTVLDWGTLVHNKRNDYGACIV